MVGAAEATKTEIARQLTPEVRGRFYEMAQKPGLSGTEAKEFCSFLAPLWFEDGARDDLRDYCHPDVGWGLILPDDPRIPKEARGRADDAPEPIRALLAARPHAKVLR
jgi:hypothetical protein